MGAVESISAVRVDRTDLQPPSLPAEELPQPNTTGAAAMDAPLSLHTIVVAASEQVSCPLGEESAILNLKNSVYYGMNPVGARVWNLLKQPTSITELRNVLLEEYEVDATRCADDLLALLETMRSEGLIEVRGAAAGA
jgi:Coenzyme PQQ synthesis protein D (PqqD)